jgi:hypothetical protein
MQGDPPEATAWEPMPLPGCLPPQNRRDGAVANSDEYRRRAGECLLFTQYVTSERSRILFVEMARSWHELAERAEQQRHQQTPAAPPRPPPSDTSEKS